MKKMKKIISVFCAAAALAGCSTVNTVEPAQSAARPNMVNDKRVITDSAVNDYARVEAVSSAVVGGLLKIQLKVYNRTTAYRTVNYKFSWFDANGMEIVSAASPWLTLALEGGETKFVSAVAPSAAAADFSVKFLADVRDY